jgi:ATP-dependent Lon protease
MPSFSMPGPRGRELVAVLPLLNSVLFPMSVVPVNVGRPRSVRLVEQALAHVGAVIGVVTQRQPEVAEPTFDDLYTVGTLARVVKVIRLGRSNYSLVLNGLGRFRIVEAVQLEPFMQATVERVPERSRANSELRQLDQQLRARTREVLELMPNLPKEAANVLDNVRGPGALADLIASNIPEEHASIVARQRILEAFEPRARVELVLGMVERQLEVLKVKDEISGSVREEMSTSQREVALRQQLRAIREELGEAAEDDEIEVLRDKIARAELPLEAERVARKQLGRIAAMTPQSAEYQVARTYLEWLSDLPWSRSTPDNVQVKEVRRCLEEDHFGLETVKQRIVEYTAIRQLRSDKRGPILLFVGPPGVGKTSLGRSIARAMGRRYGRIALGGVRDEAEIRGHRRTYVGALPGRIIQALKKVGTRNPVLVLDEVDKMGADVRGDPAAALLEVLDPEQNHTFTDHYIDLAFDLSQVVFLATANYWEHIPEALRDRLEVIELPGYTRTDKRAIAEQFLVPKQLREHGLTEEQLRFEPEALNALIDHYTHEPGVRNLEREIAAICRAITVQMAEGTAVEGLVATPELVEQLLGPHKHRPEMVERTLIPGVAAGLSLTSAGADLLFIEATRMPGRGEITVTGGMQSVMRESATTAVSFVRSRAERFGLDPEWLRSIDLHLHVPHGGSAYDAASGGVPMAVAVVSLLLGRPTRPEVAGTGELTLRGHVLPVSGVKAQLLAAHRAGIREVVMPARNARELEEVPEEVRSDLAVHLVTHLDQALGLMLGDAPAQASQEHSAQAEPPLGEIRP